MTLEVKQEEEDSKESQEAQQWEWFERKPKEEKKEKRPKWLGQVEFSGEIACSGVTKSPGQGQEKFRQGNSERSEKSRMAYCEAHGSTDRWQWHRMGVYRQENLEWFGRKPACRQWYRCQRKPRRWQIGCWWFGRKPHRKPMMLWMAWKKASAESLGKVILVCMHFQCKKSEISWGSFRKTGCNRLEKLRELLETVAAIDLKSWGCFRKTGSNRMKAKQRCSSILAKIGSGQSEYWKSWNCVIDIFCSNTDLQ